MKYVWYLHDFTKRFYRVSFSKGIYQSYDVTGNLYSDWTTTEGTVFKKTNGQLSQYGFRLIGECDTFEDLKTIFPEEFI